jgi:hypothetical protein
MYADGRGFTHVRFHPARTTVDCFPLLPHPKSYESSEPLPCTVCDKINISISSPQYEYSYAHQITADSSSCTVRPSDDKVITHIMIIVGLLLTTPGAVQPFCSQMPIAAKEERTTTFNPGCCAAQAKPRSVSCIRSYHSK